MSKNLSNRDVNLLVSRVLVPPVCTRALLTLPLKTYHNDMSAPTIQDIIKLPGLLDPHASSKTKLAVGAPTLIWAP